MKKLTTLAALALSAALFSGCTAAAMGAEASTAGVAPAGSPSSSVSAGIAGSAGSDAYIAADDAETAALTDAGLTADAVRGLHSRLEYDDGRAVYDVEFWTDTDEYDYEIDAVSGNILSVDRDAEAYAPPAASSAPTTTVTAGGGSQPDSGAITEDAARQAALDHAGVAEADAQFLHTKLDRDDGRTVYEVEFWANGSEYDYEIDAASGEILAFDYDTEHSAASGAGEAALSAEDAKRIAFAHAGVAEADATRLKVESDHDDGRFVYELEWEIGPVEYEYTIDAASGEILSFESDR